MLSRRGFLTATTAAAALAAAPSGVAAQSPKRGGTLSVRAWDPPHFDHSLVHAYKTHVVISFTHSRLLKHRAGPGVRPGSLVLKNYGPNLGYDYGGRLITAWLDR
ncbi:MAG TPA: twin-arginine translocation signal domain-containing protein [Methylomirabilota bacterium]|nr:twin-arginine translocation signal domain-containing protein [Methylomirabilota bacterium]